ncbi:hypothetical protein [Psychrobacter sp. 16-MNA-CIBAN-0192]|uniref:hypothetical protein n=2 Tax=unclassified Psychrobacter TaxID=196806 RepID=UPI003328130D
MLDHLLTVPNTDSTRPTWTMPAMLFVLLMTPLGAYAIPSNMGSFNITSQNIATGSASGNYTAARSDGSAGATGTFSITRQETNGYNGVEFADGNNGIMILNKSKQGTTADDRDKFIYTITLTPTNDLSIHTIKIGQTSYATGGNSEVARQTLSYTANPNNNITALATIRDNPSVNYFYNGMGDYFMGTRLNSTQLNSQNAVSNPQLRVDSSNASGSGLYYYNIPSLAGSGTQNPYSPIVNRKTNEVSLNSSNGILPPTPTFENIIKSINNASTYSALANNYTIPNGGTYVSYGIENSVSNYIIAVKNANTVTLTYEGIMNGNIAVAAPVIGETFNEWISFGVESEPFYYLFSGTVFNDNGGINDAQANANNATLTSGAYNNALYFNGLLDTVETGIGGSTVKLMDSCTNPTVTYATQTVTASGSNIGKYQLKLPITALSGKSSVCLVEERASNSYPIRTTNDKKSVTLTANSYDYPNHNFGRLISEHVALVLEKEQAANDCTFNDFTQLAYSKNALSSSETGAGADIKPGQCIAYKITATNRANLDINNFIMQDVLQKKDPNNPAAPKITSVLANPARTAGEYNDGLKSGDNGIVKTVPMLLNKRSKRAFFFNTQYGSTQSN